MIAATSARPLFGPYDATPLNDAGSPPAASLEGDEEQEDGRAAEDLNYELRTHLWRAIPPREPEGAMPVRFVDGSVVTRVAGALRVDGRQRPLTAAVIAAAALETEGRTLRRGAGARTRRLLCMYADGMDQEHLDAAARMLAGHDVELHTRRSTSPLRDFDTLRMQTRSIAFMALENTERDVLEVDSETPTLVDGLLERRLAGRHNNVIPAVGLVKRQIATYLPAALQQLVYDLRPGERTPAFVLRPEEIPLVNVYLRLSAQPGASPSYGIVRVQAPLEYVEATYPGEEKGRYLSALAGYLWRLRHRDESYERAGISIEPIVRVETHLHAILPSIDALIPKLHRLLGGRMMEMTP